MRTRMFSLAALVVGAALAGCSPETPATPPASSPAPPTGAPATATTAPQSAPPDTAHIGAPTGGGTPNTPAMGGAGGGMTPPFAGGPGTQMTAEQALVEAEKQVPEYKTQSAAVAKAEAALKAKPDDAAAKAAYVTATYDYAIKIMNDGKLPSPVMYRAALALHRRGLKVDPAHEKSLASKNQIEGIYQQMGRPIPQ